MSTTPAPQGLKYSDYVFIGALVTGIVGTSTFTGIVPSDQAVMITGVAGILTTIFASISKFLASKGD